MYRFPIAVVMVIVFVGCCYVMKERPRGGDVPVSCDSLAAGQGLTVVTYNVGLAPGLVGYSTPRLPHVVDAISRLDADVICIQEVWKVEFKQAIIESLGLSPENVYYAETQGMGEIHENVCTERQIRGIAKCVREHCGDAYPEEVAVCALENCRARGVMMYITARKCLNCLIATAGKDMDTVERICVNGPGASYVYEGQNGNMLISRYPIKKREVLHLRASNANRVALFATIDPGGGDPIEVACTHLSSKSHISPTHPDFTEWEDEQRAQLVEISDVLHARAQGRPKLLVGDLNIGRKNGWYLGDHLRPVWNTAMSLGYYSPADDAVVPFCSACADNMLRKKDTNFLIDHVMVYRNGGPSPLTPVCVERLFDEEIEVRGYDGSTVRTRYSDHYAVKVVFMRE